MTSSAELENKLGENRKIFSLYDVAITEQERQLDKARRGKLTFTQIDNSTLLGLLRGDLNRLHEDKAQIGRDIEELEEKIRSLKKVSPPPEAGLSVIENQEPENSESVVAEDNGVVKGDDEAPQEEPADGTLDSFIRGGTNQEIDQLFNPSEDFIDNDIDTPDILTNHQILDSLQAIEGSDDVEPFEL